MNLRKNMEIYTKINTLYARYKNLGSDCPNPKWKKFQNKIIFGKFSDPTFKYLYNCLWEGYSKIDGTNSKIAFYPSTQEICVEGKTEKAQSQHGQFEMLEKISERIKPQLCDMFPKESARFAPIKDGNKIQFYNLYSESGKAEDGAVETTIKFDKEDSISEGGLYGVQLEEVPIYIYGEYFGQGIQKCGGRYFDHNDFHVFDMEVQGWWIPKEMRDDYCKELGLKTVPFVGVNTLSEFEKMVTEGFETKVEGVKDPTLIEEGIVARPVVPIKDQRGNRIIVKIKYCDYKEYNDVRKEFTDEEFKEFNDWYNENVEKIF